MRTCTVCQGENRRPRSPFCSRSCEHKARYKRKPRKRATCEQCGCPMWSVNNRRFCGGGCRARSYNARRDPVERRAYRREQSRKRRAREREIVAAARGGPVNVVRFARAVSLAEASAIDAK